MLFKPKDTGYVLYSDPIGLTSRTQYTALPRDALLLLLEKENLEHPNTMKFLYKDTVGWIERVNLEKVKP